jgi:hypothetical protein
LTYLNVIPPSIYREALIQLSKFAVARAY